MRTKGAILQKSSCRFSDQKDHNLLICLEYCSVQNVMTIQLLTG